MSSWSSSLPSSLQQWQEPLEPSDFNMPAFSTDPGIRTERGTAYKLPLLLRVFLVLKDLNVQPYSVSTICWTGSVVVYQWHRYYRFSQYRDILPMYLHTTLYSCCTAIVSNYHHLFVSISTQLEIHRNSIQQRLLTELCRKIWTQSLVYLWWQVCFWN